MAKLYDLPPEIIRQIVQQIPKAAAALAFCSASKQLWDAYEAEVWAREVYNSSQRPCPATDVVRGHALKRGYIHLYRRLLAHTGIGPDMRDLSFACWQDHHALVDEILSNANFNASLADVPEDYEFAIHNVTTFYSNYFNGSPLINACCQDNVAMVRKLLGVPGIRASVNRIWRQDYHGPSRMRRRWVPSRYGSAVHAAAASTNPGVLLAILEAGGDPNSGLGAGEGLRSGDGDMLRTPLVVALDFQRPMNVEALCVAGADLSFLRGHRSQAIQRIASQTKNKPWDQFIPFLVYRATKLVPATWLLGIAAESQSYDLTRELLRAYPELLDTANALILAYKKFPFQQGSHRSLVYKTPTSQRTIQYRPRVRYLTVLCSDVGFDKLAWW